MATLDTKRLVWGCVNRGRAYLAIPVLLGGPKSYELRRFLTEIAVSEREGIKNERRRPFIFGPTTFMRKVPPQVPCPLPSRKRRVFVGFLNRMGYSGLIHPHIAIVFHKIRWYLIARSSSFSYFPQHLWLSLAKQLCLSPSAVSYCNKTATAIFWKEIMPPPLLPAPPFRVPSFITAPLRKI